MEVITQCNHLVYASEVAERNQITEANGARRSNRLWLLQERQQDQERR
jgi:hypothetical protein